MFRSWLFDKQTFSLLKPQNVSYLYHGSIGEVLSYQVIEQGHSIAHYWGFGKQVDDRIKLYYDN